MATKLPVKFPSVRQVTNANITIVKRIAGAQKEYAQNVLSAVRPASKPAPKPAPKATTANARTTKPRATTRKTS